jgi:hypothetical protein
MKVTRARCGLLVVAVFAAAILQGCETSPATPSTSGPPPTPTPSPAPAPIPTPAPTQYQVTIALIALDPFVLDVPVGVRVTFRNNDPSSAHHFASSCPEIDSVGLLQFQQSGQTAPFTSSKSCGYYDLLSPENILRQGRINVH